MDMRNTRPKKLTQGGAAGIVEYLASRGYSATFKEGKVWISGYYGEVLIMQGAIEFLMREVKRKERELEDKVLMLDLPNS